MCVPTRLRNAASVCFGFRNCVYIPPVVFILDGNSEHVAHSLRKTGLFRERKIRFVTFLGLIECLKQIRDCSLRAILFLSLNLISVPCSLWVLHKTVQMQFFLLRSCSEDSFCLCVCIYISQISTQKGSKCSFSMIYFAAVSMIHLV